MITQLALPDVALALTIIEASRTRERDFSLSPACNVLARIKLNLIVTYTLRIRYNTVPLGEIPI